MTAPKNMATIAASLESSLQHHSLNHHDGGRGHSYAAGLERSSSSDDVSLNHRQNADDAALELNSHISLPYHWEQCLDLKTGEIYYINWKTGMKATEDPGLTAGYYSEEEDEDGSSFDSEESSTESFPLSSSTRELPPPPPHGDANKDNVLVVGGCKICLMYYMVLKQVEDCPKCSSQLLHFDRSENVSV